MENNGFFLKTFTTTKISLYSTKGLPSCTFFFKERRRERNQAAGDMPE
jgi:hypothetical protein